jgi:multidrug efflux pump subunit AcrA (membrane-fusion protein)
VEVKNTEELIKLAKDQLDIERKEVNRLAGLIQERIVTDSAMDKAKQAELTSRNSLVRLQNELQLMKTRKTRLRSAKELVATDLELAELSVARTEITAAVDGVVVQDLAEQDSYVQKGSPLFTLEDTSAVEVKCRLRMEELHWLWRQAGSQRSAQAVAADYQIPQTPVTVTYELTGQDGVRYEWQGVLSRYDGLGLDEVTRTVPCRVVVPDPRAVNLVGADAIARPSGAPPALVRGMFVSIQLHIDQPDPLFLVPEPAVQPGKAVWVVRDGVLALVKPLTLIELIERQTEAGDLESHWLVESKTSALTPGDRVVVPPFGVLSAGMAVEEDGTP